MEQILAWHFTGGTLRDGSPLPADGVWLKHKGPLVICKSGLHASIDPFDALRYAPGATLCRVALRGKIARGDDKLCATERMIICRMDATELLRYFARMQALSVVHSWDAPDVVLDWLMTGDTSIQNAAWSAAWSAAGSAAGSAAWSAAGSAWSAWSAAWSAAGSVAWSAAGSAWSAARDDFNLLINECFEGAK